MSPTTTATKRFPLSTFAWTAFLFLFPLAAVAGSYSVTTVYSPLLTNMYNHTCSDRVYDPEVFALPSGDLRLLAQGNNDNVTDYFFGFTRDHATGAWTIPTASNPVMSPSLSGAYARCGYTPTTPGPIASPAVVHVDDRYYMAYSGGNADGITGKVYWAMSYDGLSWNLYDWNPPSGQLLTPIVNPYYHEECSGLNGNNPSGVGQVSLSYENGYFYVHMRYAHFSGSFLSAEVVAFRFSYNSQHPYGIGPTHEIYQDGQWIADSGNLVWDYDNQPAIGSDPILKRGHGMTGMNIGAGDVKFDSRVNGGSWVHFYQGEVGQPIYWESASSLASGQWTFGGQVDTSIVSGTQHYPGVYNGPLCNGCASGNYMFIPVGLNGCMDFSGVGIAITNLVYQ